MKTYYSILVFSLVVFTFSSLYAEIISITRTSRNYGSFDHPDTTQINIGDKFSLYRNIQDEKILIGKVKVVRNSNNRDVVQFSTDKKNTKISIGDYIDTDEFNNMNVTDEFYNIDVMENTNVTQNSRLPLAVERNKLESWYTFWGLGFAGVSYSGELESTMKEIQDIPGSSRQSMSLDMLGFYWPTSENMILGFIINGWGDRYTIDKTWMQINGYLYSASMMHFIHHRIGDGFFIRTDIGATRLVAQSSENITTVSDWGYGFAAGLGYGVPITPGTRFLITAKYALKNVENDNYNSFTFSIGGLF